MPPFRRSSTQAADWRWPAQASPDTPAVYLPSFVLHPMAPGSYVIAGDSQPGPTSPAQATCSVQAGYVLPSPPPFPRHGFANQRRPHPEQRARPVAHPSVRDKISNTRTVFTANVQEARDTGSAGNSSSFPTCKFDCLLCGLQKDDCIARSMCLASVLMCYAAEMHALL